MVAGMEKFGEFVRREREAKEIGLREMAKRLASAQPTYRRSSATSSRRRPRTR
jgi:hypothetical protein